MERVSEQNDRNPGGKFFFSIFIFYESLISPVGTSSNYFKLAPLETNIPRRIQLKMKKSCLHCVAKELRCLRQGADQDE